MPVIIFGPQLVNGKVIRVVDLGSGKVPRLAVETQQLPDAMGTRGWSGLGVIDVDTFAAMLLAAGIIQP